MNYKTLLLNGLIVCSVLPCFAAQEAQDVGWKTHEAPEDLEEGQFYNSKTLHMEKSILHVALSPDERFLGVGRDGSQSIIDMKTGRNICNYRNRQITETLAWMHNVPFIVGVLGGDIEIKNPLSGEMVQKFKGQNLFGVRSIAVSRDDAQIVSGSRNKTVKIWDVRSGKCTQILKGHNNCVNSVAISLDGKTVVSGSWDKTVKVWDIRSDKWVKTLRGHDDWVMSVVIGRDDKMVVSGSKDKTVNIWDIRSGFFSSFLFSQYRKLYGQYYRVNSLVISSNDKVVVSGSDDKTLMIYYRVSGKRTQILKGHRMDVKSVAMSSDNTKIFSGSCDGTVKVWEKK